MSQMQGMYGDPYGQAMTEPPRTSGLAIWALVCSLILCCPVTTILGVLLGVGALVSIGSNPARRGKGLAVAAIIFGLAFTTAQVIGGSIFYTKIIKPSMELVMSGPGPALKAGFGGDVAGFKAQFYGRGAAATDEAATAFITELRTRYGEFRAADIDKTQKQNPTMGQPVATLPYVLAFDQNSSVASDTELVFADQATGAFIFKLGSITVKDSDKGDLTFP